MILQVNDIRYFVEVKGEGQPLVFLHGFTGDTTTWSSVTDSLSESYQCISIDLIGHGRTDSPEDDSRYTMDRVSEDICCILDELDVGPAVLIGYSMGGRTALHFSLNYPEKVKALILESSSPGLKAVEARAERKKKDEVLADRIEKGGIEAFVDFWQEIPLFASQKRLSDKERSEIRKQRLSQSVTGLSNSLRGMGTGAQDSLWEELEELSVPVHVLVGELDQKFVGIAENMKKINPMFNIVTFSNTGHAIHVEEPRKFGTIIEDLLLTT
ncbi:MULTISPECIES: 2-succinyl-6-hydroxy-2,4-cyclohexadiene-1-carboxylate synthase [Bacillaceae]|uniref:2-succinyl-6-hydroxy-2, 4-cyclohexadiene-1-carboxylate synthase n=1 Tax=Bacillaceae TaxID=186817 RepID=UPI001C55B5AF|nr:2-succinyl-6-hydroxy-2,4-cyclohexadiene-1-carboxylate synthase [Rossellomorea sp. YZS02]MBW3114836.1 2-succinyl-6-hydroxy-2,4-cyclohexadiene-1-carboxylate synthase [Bacillus sp. MCCB 382]MDX8345349.1 2-succinyl-6-hydroxy-2,4-cyclohexadiene-1-carboxylate synthase [Rossellomorea sp. YZS02]